MWTPPALCILSFCMYRTLLGVPSIYKVPAKYQVRSTKYQPTCLSWNKAELKESKDYKTAINLGFKYPASSHEKSFLSYFSDHPDGHTEFYCRYFTYTDYSIAHVYCFYFTHPSEAVPQLPEFCGHKLKASVIKTLHLMGKVEKSSGLKIEKIKLLWDSHVMDW